MKYVHVRNLQKYHPGYKDRNLQWAKIYFKVVQGDPDCELITNEVDWGRLIKFILLELQAQKPIPLDEIYLSKKGFNLKKRPISLTLNMLHNFIEVIQNESKTCGLDKDKEEEEDKEKEVCTESSVTDKLTHLDFVKLTEKELSSLTDKFGKKNTDNLIDNLNDYLGSTGKKYKSHYHTLLVWAKRDKVVKPYEENYSTVEEREEVSEEGRAKIKELIKGIGT